MFFALVFRFLHWCYSLTALLSANQNRVIFSCIIIIIIIIIINLSDKFYKNLLHTREKHQILRIYICWQSLSKNMMLQKLFLQYSVHRSISSFKARL